MANNRNVYQQLTNVSINKKQLIEISKNIALSKKDLRVLLILFTELNGWSEPKNGKEIKDPFNFKKIDIESIAETLDLKKKEVKECIRNLMDAGLIEPGDNDTVKNGYRFTF